MSPEDFAARYNVSRETISRLQVYHDLLVKWQKAVNLVSPKTISEIWSRHFADSAQLASFVPQNFRVADLGSGAGFPGMILAVLRPDLEIHLIESDEKKSQFLKNVSRETFSKTTIHNGRVEKILGGLAVDIITARAFAPLVEILTMIPVGSTAQLLLLKGKTASEEVSVAEKIFGFSCENLPSANDPEGRILKIANVKKL